MSPRPKNQRGYALLTVLAAIVVLSAIVVPFHADSRVQLRLVSRQAELEQTRLAAGSGVTLARRLLESDTDNVDGPTDTWALPLELDRDDLHFSIRIEDQDGKLGIGGLLDLGKPELAARTTELERLMRILGHSQSFVPALLDWIDPDDQSRPGGAENLTYVSLGLVCKNRDPDTIAELYHVRGALASRGEDQPEWERFLSTRQAGDSEGEVNVNTAPPEVLLALSDKLTRQLVSTLVERRTRKPFQRPSDLHDVPGMSNETYNDFVDERIKTSSSRFTIRSTAALQGAESTVVAEVDRSGSNTKLLSWSVQ
jgi:general secretion pathway protein K